MEEAVYRTECVSFQNGLQDKQCKWLLNLTDILLIENSLGTQWWNPGQSFPTSDLTFVIKSVLNHETCHLI